MPAADNLDTPESPDERMARRRARRWKRRARIVGPFIGVMLLVGALALSVDLIEYQPQEARDRLSDRPLPEALRDQQQAVPQPVRTSLSTTSVMSADRVRGAGTLDPTASAAPVRPPGSMDVTLDTRGDAAQRPAQIRPIEDFPRPTPPYASRGLD